MSIDEQKYFELCSLAAFLTNSLNNLRRVVRSHPNDLDKIYTQIHLLEHQIEQVESKIQELPNY